MEDKKLSVGEVERERVWFEACCASVNGSIGEDDDQGAEEISLETQGGCYVSPITYAAWIAWQARATLARHPQPEGGEVVEVVATVDGDNRQRFLRWNPQASAFKHEIGAELVAMTEHKRLLAERDARIEALTEYAAAVEKSADKAEQERDQLLARVGELEKMLGACLTYATRMEPMSAKLMNAIDAALTQPSGGKESQ